MSASAPRVVRDADLDWSKFDNGVARDGSIDPVDKALYAAISSFADKDTHATESGQGGADLPTRQVLAACIGKSVDTVDRATARLEYKWGLIRVERRKDPDNPKANLPSVYHLLDHHRWDARAAERRAKRQAEANDPAPAPPAQNTGSLIQMGGRTRAARGSRTGAAVLSSFPEGLSPEGACAVPDAARPPADAGSKTDEREDPQKGEAPPASPAKVDHSAPKGEAPPSGLNASAESVVAAFVEARPGVPVSAASRAKVRAGARELLAHGHRADRLGELAADMAVRGAGRWTDLVRHAESNARLLAVPAPRPVLPEGEEWCVRHRGARLEQCGCGRDEAAVPRGRIRELLGQHMAAAPSRLPRPGRRIESPRRTR